MQAFEEAFAAAFRTDNSLLAGVNEYVLRKKGKQLRPALVLLTAKLLGEVNTSSIQAALSVELLHTASLIHDDVVDETMERRGKASVNARWSNKIAVLAGDYLLSKSLLHATETQNIDILSVISRIGVQLSEGELQQLSNMQKGAVSEEEYFTIIRKKTAMLFASCTKIGAISAGADKETRLHLERYGEFLGICFQIKDDIFDYSENDKIGKPTRNDIREGKITLPLIHALGKSTEALVNDIREWIRSRELSPEHIKEIVAFVHRNGGIAYAEEHMQIYKEKAIGELQTLPDCQAKEALIACAEFAAKRSV